MDVFLRNLSGFRVHRGEKDEWAMRHAAKVLRHEQTLGIFSEGKRSKGKGLSIAKPGTARLALEMNCPIVPMAIVGSDQFFKRFSRRTCVQTTLLSPLLPKPGESALTLTALLMFTLAQALPEKMRGAYAKHPEDFTM